jgi:hypothetical protein
MDREHLIGTWRLIDQIETLSDGTQILPCGEHPLGLLMYAANGWMSVQLLRSERAARADLAEFQTAMEEYLGYFGTFTVDPARAIITHHIVGCSYPAYSGTDQVRQYTLYGDTLTLTAQSTRGQRILTWQRVI